MNQRTTLIFSTILFMVISNLASGQNQNFYIFLCFGQSNMEGQGTISAADREVDDRFQVYQTVDCSNLNREKGNWYTAIPPLTRCWSRLSPSDYFGRTLIENLPDHVKVGIINVSVGGCRLELFDKDIYENYTDTYADDWFQNIITSYNGNPYQYLVDAALEAQKDGVIKGILLHQGESNNGDSQWPNKVQKIYNDLISDLSLDAADIPLLAGELVHEDQNGALAGMNTIINQLPDVLPNSYVIPSSGCTAQDDNIHFDAAGYRELGTRYANKMLELLAPAAPLLSDQETNLQIKTYPNPGEDRVTFSFFLQGNSPVSIDLLDASGRQISTITSGDFAAGKHELTKQLQLDSGVYFYSLKSNFGVVQKKIIIQ